MYENHITKKKKKKTLGFEVGIAIANFLCVYLCNYERGHGCRIHIWH